MRLLLASLTRRGATLLPISVPFHQLPHLEPPSITPSPLLHPSIIWYGASDKGTAAASLGSHCWFRSFHALARHFTRELGQLISFFKKQKQTKRRNKRRNYRQTWRNQNSHNSFRVRRGGEGTPSNYHPLPPRERSLHPPLPRSPSCPSLLPSHQTTSPRHLLNLPLSSPAAHFLPSPLRPRRFL